MYDASPPPAGPSSGRESRPGAMNFGGQFEDVPAPRNFEMDPASYTVQIATYRRGRWRYRGEMDASLTVAFYLNTLPQTGWSPECEPVEDERMTTLTYTPTAGARREILTVKIFREGNLTVAEIDLSPERA